MKRRVRLANCTMHPQNDYLDAFRALGYDVDPRPLLRTCAGAEDAKAAACEALKAAAAQDAEGILLGGRTDMCVYAAMLAVMGGFKVFVAETERIRDANDAFVFNLKGVTQVDIAEAVDEYDNLLGAAVVGVPDPPATISDDMKAINTFQWLVDNRPLEVAARHKLHYGKRVYSAAVNGAGLDVLDDDTNEIIATVDKTTEQ